MTPENTTPDDPTLIRRAQRRVAMRMGFYTHVLVYAVVNGGLFVLNISQGGPLWSFWPMAGWGIGLLAHGLATWFSLNGEGMRERMLTQEIERLRKP